MHKGVTALSEVVNLVVQKRICYVCTSACQFVGQCQVVLLSLVQTFGWSCGG